MGNRDNTPEKPERDDDEDDEDDERDDPGYSDQDSGLTLGDRMP